jgi:hypothetical protein
MASDIPGKKPLTDESGVLKSPRVDPDDAAASMRQAWHDADRRIARPGNHDRQPARRDRAADRRLEFPIHGGRCGHNIRERHPGPDLDALAVDRGTPVGQQPFDAGPHKPIRTLAGHERHLDQRNVRGGGASHECHTGQVGEPRQTVPPPGASTRGHALVPGVGDPGSQRAHDPVVQASARSSVCSYLNPQMVYTRRRRPTLFRGGRQPRHQNLMTV